MSLAENHGKRRQVAFRIGPVAEERLKQHAELFNLEPSVYAKAVLHRDLAIFTEPLDERRRNWQGKKRVQEAEDESGELIGFQGNRTLENAEEEEREEPV